MISHCAHIKFVEFAVVHFCTVNVLFFLPCTYASNITQDEYQLESKERYSNEYTDNEEDILVKIDALEQKLQLLQKDIDDYLNGAGQIDLEI